MAQRPEWGDWLREQFDRHPTIRINADLSRAGGVKSNGRPVIDPSSVTAWLRGRRPSYELAQATARAFGVDEYDALRAAGYIVSGEGHATATFTATGEGHAPSARPVGLGLDDAAAGLTPEQIESVRAVIRAMKPPPEGA